MACARCSAAVDAEHVLEATAAKDQDPVEAVGENGGHPALGEGFAFGAWKGVRITLISLVRKTSSKGG